MQFHQINFMIQSYSVKVAEEVCPMLNLNSMKVDVRKFELKAVLFIGCKWTKENLGDPLNMKCTFSK